MSRGCILFLLSLFVLPAGAQSTSEIVRRQLTAQGNAAFEHNAVCLLPSAEQKYADMQETIAQAQRFVHLEYFNFRNDSIGHVLLRLLGEKARQGVEVRLLIDAFGNRKNTHPFTKKQIDSLCAAGIHTCIFDPMRFPWINHMLHRDHRKIVVVDGRFAYTGGMNVADYYVLGTKRTGTWRDMHVRLEGPVVQAYEEIFERIWGKETGEHLDALLYTAPNDARGDKLVTVVNREPKAWSKRIVEAYVAAIDAARHEIRIVNPYPTGVREVRRALYRALARGVKVKFMVSYSSDTRITPDVAALHMWKLMNRGAQVYYYMNGFHHSKTMTVDGELCTIGTANLDGRSLRFDYEVNAFVFDSNLTAQLNAQFDEDLQEAWLLTRENYKKKFSLGHRMSGRIFSSIKGQL